MCAANVKNHYGYQYLVLAVSDPSHFIFLATSSILVDLTIGDNKHLMHSFNFGLGL